MSILCINKCSKISIKNKSRTKSEGKCRKQKKRSLPADNKRIYCLQ